MAIIKGKTRAENNDAINATNVEIAMSTKAPKRASRLDDIANLKTQCFLFDGKMAGVLFEDIFDVKDMDPEGKKFDRGK